MARSDAATSLTAEGRELSSGGEAGRQGEREGDRQAGKEAGRQATELFLFILY